MSFLEQSKQHNFRRQWFSVINILFDILVVVKIIYNFIHFKTKKKHYKYLKNHNFLTIFFIKETLKVVSSYIC